MHKGQIPSGSRVLIIDDLLATGGTMAATKELIEMHGAITVGFSFLIELSFLAGRKKIGSDKVFSLINYSGD
jgi:adenine phosphoribosyltransferase